ncbi:MAG: 2-C-methyl-D-erythritol 2,4-cyclodiphosphate synthase [Candidatus Binatia bacterium]
MRVGEGYDVHRLVEGRPLMLACVEIPSEFGCLGHSDGDAVSHAVCDAILGALALGDMGRHFPSTDRRWEGASSAEFLAVVAGLAAESGARLVNLDVTVIIERPRLAPYIGAMREGLARRLGCSVACVSVKAKTADGLGAVGRGEAVEARAVALVEISSQADVEGQGG